MSLNITSTEINYLGFAATFICISLGFLFVKIVLKAEKGPGLWSLSFFMNSLGFVFWSGKIRIAILQYFLIGEIAHMSGFILLLVGINNFIGRRIKIKDIVSLVIFLGVWILMILNFKSNMEASIISLRLLRTVLFCVAGFLIFMQSPKKKNIGEILAGTSLMLWGVYNLLYGFIRAGRFNDYVFGILVGLQVLTAFGLVSMMVNKIYIKAEKTELRVNQLEMLLPICAHCRRIRDKKNEWHNIETYIEQQTSSQFSHGICPDCLKEHYPEYASRINI